MQAGSINDMSQNIDYLNSTIKLNSNNNSDQNTEKSFKDVLSDNDMDGYEADVSSNSSEDCVNFDLSNEIEQDNELVINQEMSLVDVLFINSNAIRYEKSDDCDIECKCDKSTLDNASDFSEVAIDVDNHDIDNHSENDDLVGIQKFSKIDTFDQKIDKDAILKEDLADYYVEDPDKIIFQSNDKVLIFDSVSVTEAKESQCKESFDNSINIDKMTDFNEKDEINQELDKKTNSDETLVKASTISDNNKIYGNSLNQKKIVENGKYDFELKNNVDKKSTEPILDFGMLKVPENIKLSDTVEPKLHSSNVQFRVINDTKNALAECIKSKDGEFDLYLEPKTLGVLKIKVSFKENNSISVTFNATNHQAIDILKQESSDIVNMISSLGFDVNSESLNFNFSQSSQDQNFTKHSFNDGNGNLSDSYIENVDKYKKIWILNDQNVDILV